MANNGSIDFGVLIEQIKSEIDKARQEAEKTEKDANNSIDYKVEKESEDNTKQ